MTDSLLNAIWYILVRILTNILVIYSILTGCLSSVLLFKVNVVPNSVNFVIYFYLDLGLSKDVTISVFGITIVREIIGKREMN